MTLELAKDTTQQGFQDNLLPDLDSLGAVLNSSFF